MPSPAGVSVKRRNRPRRPVLHAVQSSTPTGACQGSTVRLDDRNESLDAERAPDARSQRKQSTGARLVPALPACSLARLSRIPQRSRGPIARSAEAARGSTRPHPTSPDCRKGRTVTTAAKPVWYTSQPASTRVRFIARALVVGTGTGRTAGRDTASAGERRTGTQRGPCDTACTGWPVSGQYGQGTASSTASWLWLLLSMRGELLL